MEKYQKIYPNVHLGEGVILEDWVVIGVPPLGAAPGELETIIEKGSVIRSHTVIYAGSHLGEGFQTGHRCVLGTGLTIAANCSVGTHSVVFGSADFAPRVRVHGYCTIAEACQIRESAWVGPHCVVDSSLQFPTIIEAGAILGAELYIAPGVRVGERALIAAGVSLYEDAPAHRLIAGNPPRALRNIARLTCPYDLIEHPYAEIEA